jgi:dihydrofolate synthase/folylpolyglutamate synthase
MPNLETYEEAVVYLNSLASVEAHPDDPKLRRVLRLERMKDLMEPACADVGDPYSLKAVHVAGTKGKGSVASMLTAMLTEANFNVGTYTSPHVTHVEERIAVAGRPVSRGELHNLLSAVSSSIEKSSAVQPTYFEIMTTCAIRAFLERKVDIAVLEVGLGGRLDSTNILPNVACAITNISIDHTDYLGDTLKQIAREKAGVIKGAPVVSARQKPEAMEVLRETCESTGSPLLVVGKDIGLGERDVMGNTQNVSVSTWRREFHDLNLSVRGARQHENLGVALGIIELLEEREGLAVETQEVRRALRSVRIPARLEFFPGAPSIIIDGAHNEASIENLIHHVRLDVEARRIVTIFNIARDKKVKECLAMVCSVSSVLILTQTSNPRSCSIGELEAALPDDFPEENVRKAADPTAGFSLALEESEPEDLLLVTGSFYLAGVLRAIVLDRQCQQDETS